MCSMNGYGGLDAAVTPDLGPHITLKFEENSERLLACPINAFCSRIGEYASSDFPRSI